MAADGRRLRPGVRARVVVGASVVVGSALVLGAALLVVVLDSELERSTTASARLRATDVAALAGAGSLPERIATIGDEDALIQVVDASGAVVAASDNIEGEPALPAVRPRVGERRVFTLSSHPLADDERLRIVAIGVDTPRGPVVVYAGESLERADAVAAAVRRVLLLGLPVLVGVVAGITALAVHRAMLPVRRITNTMSEITATDLHRRVPEPQAADDIGRLAATVNDTLRRLESAVARQRQFVADASHELRGPLAALRSDLEISVTHPDHTPWPDVARNTLGDVERLQQLAEDLLLLARLDGDRRSAGEVVDLGEAARSATRDVRRAGVDVRVDAEPGCEVVGSRSELERMVRNLVDNAQRHAGGEVRVDVSRVGGTVRLRVADDGPGIPVEDRDRVFERFVRLDDARTRDAGGAGLGLAIVQEVVTLHGGTVTIGDAVPTGAVVTVELPASPR